MPLRLGPVDRPARQLRAARVRRRRRGRDRPGHRPALAAEVRSGERTLASGPVPIARDWRQMRGSAGGCRPPSSSSRSSNSTAMTRRSIRTSPCRSPRCSSECFWSSTPVQLDCLGSSHWTACFQPSSQTTGPVAGHDTDPGQGPLRLLGVPPCFAIRSSPIMALVALCGAAPAGRYVISNGTVADSKTGLTWEQAVDPKGASLAGAQAICDTLSLGGQGGWRLPTVKELYSILDFEGGSATGSVPMIDPTAFPGSSAYRQLRPILRRDAGLLAAGLRRRRPRARGELREWPGRDARGRRCALPMRPRAVRGGSLHL